MRRSHLRKMGTVLRAGAALALGLVAAGCSSVGSTIFPERADGPGPAPVQTTATAASLPSAGTSIFAPVAVTPGSPTGTPQGDVITNLRARLVAVQGELSSRNANISDIRQRAAAEGALYRLAKGDATIGGQVNAQKLANAQAALDRFAAQTAALDGEVRVFAKGSADTARLMTESDGVRSANEEDLKQLNRLRGEIAKTGDQIDKLVNDLSTEAALQNAFLARERATMASLGSASAIPATNVSAVTTFGPAVAAPAALLASSAFVTIKFDRPNMSYREALSSAIGLALKRKPDANFDVVGVVAPRSNPDDNLARTQQVAQTLAALGVNTAKVRLMTGVSPAISTPEVRVYAR